MSKSTKKWLLGILATVIAGLIVHFFTTGELPAIFMGMNKHEVKYVEVTPTFVSATPTPKSYGSNVGSEVNYVTKEYVPDSVDLLSLNAYFEGSVAYEYGVTDTMGNKYETALMGYRAPKDVRDWNAQCFCIWDIGGEYRTLTATGFIRAADKGATYEGSYKIYGDGRLLYSQSGLGCMTKPYPVSVDISGVTDLKIEMYGDGNGGVGLSGIRSALGNVTLHR